MSVLTLTDFLAEIAAHFEIPVEHLQALKPIASSGLDSLMMYECFLLVEEMSGAVFSADAIDSIVSLEDLYHLYRQFE